MDGSRHMRKSIDRRLSRPSVLASFACALLFGVQPGRAQDSPGPQSLNEARLEERIKQLETLIRKMPDPAYVRGLEDKLRQMPDADEIRTKRATIQQLSDRMKQLPAAAPPA